MSLVLDASAAMAGSFADERTAAIEEVFRTVKSAGAWVPSIWKLEVANTLQLAVVRGRIVGAVRDNALTSFASMPIHVDAATDVQAWTATLQLAIRHSLTLYDAAYLELALRRHLPLATLNRELRQAAKAENVAVLGE